MRFSKEEYWGPHLGKYGAWLTAELRTNTDTLVFLLNGMCIDYERLTADVRARPLNSGWRPAPYNEELRQRYEDARALGFPHGIPPCPAVASKHITCQAADIRDEGNVLDRFFDSPQGEGVLQKNMLWREHPDATPGWCHLQCVPPAGWRAGMPRTFRP